MPQKTPEASRGRYVAALPVEGELSITCTQSTVYVPDVGLLSRILAVYIDGDIRREAQAFAGPVRRGQQNVPPRSNVVLEVVARTGAELPTARGTNVRGGGQEVVLERSVETERTVSARLLVVVRNGEVRGSRERLGELIQRLGMRVFLKAVDLPAVPQMVKAPRTNPYVFFWPEDLKKEVK